MKYFFIFYLPYFTLNNDFTLNEDLLPCLSHVKEIYHISEFLSFFITNVFVFLVNVWTIFCILDNGNLIILK
jgi:hypothetical protein